MSTLDALTAAWTAAEAALPLGWRVVGVMRRELALQVLPELTDIPEPAWCAMALDEALVLHAAWGEHHYQALMNLAIKLREIRGSATG